MFNTSLGQSRSNNRTFPSGYSPITLLEKGALLAILRIKFSVFCIQLQIRVWSFFFFSIMLVSFISLFPTHLCTY